MSTTFFEGGEQTLNNDRIFLTRFCGPETLPNGDLLEPRQCLQISISHDGHILYTSLTTPEVRVLISQLMRFHNGVNDGCEVHSFDKFLNGPEFCPALDLVTPTKPKRYNKT